MGSSWCACAAFKLGPPPPGPPAGLACSGIKFVARQPKKCADDHDV
eukprot:SAG22_NODE_234_length_14360_cov_13.245915_10_plen_46_part_00